jgi:hypothetical protein
MLITIDYTDRLCRKKWWRERKKWRERNGDERKVMTGERPAKETTVGARLGFVSSPYLDSS